MKRLKRLGAFLMAAALTLGLTAGPEPVAAGEPQPVEEQGMTLLGAAGSYPQLVDHSLELRVGESKKIRVKNCEGLKVTYKVDDKSIATVSKTGKVKGKKEGRTYVTVIVKTKSGEKRGGWDCRVDIKPALASKKTVKETIGAGKQLQIKVFPTVKNAEMEIVISTKSEDENLKLDIGIPENENNYAARVPVVDHITPVQKKVTVTTSKKVIIWNNSGTSVDVTVQIKTLSGKKTISSVQATVL